MAAEHSRRNSGGFFFIFVVFNTETNLTIHVLITISFLFFGVFFFVFSIIEKKDEQIPRKISLKKKVSFFFVLVNRQEKDERFFCKIYYFFQMRHRRLQSFLFGFIVEKKISKICETILLKKIKMWQRSASGRCGGRFI